MTTCASLIADKNPEDLVSFADKSKCFLTPRSPLKSRPKYRPINGYGINLKHPYWGAAGTSFARFGPKTYDDGVYSVRRSVDSSELPSPRTIVQEVLLKAEKYPRTSNDPNELINFFVLTITHDLAFQVPTEAHQSCQNIRCCTSGNKEVLSKDLQNSACLPIAVNSNDSFYKTENVKCLTMVRSEIVSNPDAAQYGEILNKVTALIDLSILYGSEKSEADKLRSRKGGKLNTGSKNLLPTDVNGFYTPIASRLTSVPVSAIWPTIFGRNHNNLCEGLAAINPSWCDEKLFQEARRINIAIFQNLIIGGTVVEQLAKKKINVTYDEEVNPSTSLEFTTGAYRFLHYYLNSYMKLITEAGEVTEIPFSDTFGRIDLVEDRFDDVLRGSMNQKLNYGQYTDEIYNKFAKNERGMGLDVISTDIQRGKIEKFRQYSLKCFSFFRT